MWTDNSRNAKCLIYEMGMKILILTFFFEIKESEITRGHNFSQRTINVWNKLSEECVHASSVLCSRIE